ncbi:NlpC/P60 family protein [Pseudonocardia nematodicida]|uniref:NlpC/P60 family protein n=1 Tax=Pseudonocardia nematodicida TaxID=1206997 RepID=A0ABV1KIS7_9PSEU
MTTALNPATAPTAATDAYPVAVPRRRRDRDATAGISAAELLARYSEAGFDAPATGGRRATRTAGPGGFGPATERIGAPLAVPAPAGPHSDGPHSDDTVVSRDVPAGLAPVGLLRGGGTGGTGGTGPFGSNPRAVVATMSATLVGATAVMGVVTAIGSPGEQTTADAQPGVDLTGASGEATMALSVPAAGAEQGGPGASEAAAALGSGIEQVTSVVPEVFEQADAASIAAVAREEAEQEAAELRESAGRTDGAGSGTTDGAGASAGSSSGTAGMQALAAATSQLGKPYAWGATGPSAFDCSGLMVWAFEQLGVDIPRTSSAQSQMSGESVSKSDLQPGDLVFFYSPVSHVGLYAGNGQILHASTSGEPVKYSNIDAMPFHSATRV